VVLTADQGVPFRTTVPITDFAEGPVTMALPPGFAARKSLTLSLGTDPEAPWVLVQMAVAEGY